MTPCLFPCSAVTAVSMSFGSMCCQLCENFMSAAVVIEHKAWWPVGTTLHLANRLVSSLADGTSKPCMLVTALVLNHVLSLAWHDPPDNLALAD